MSNEHDAVGNRTSHRARRESSQDAEDEAMLARRTSPKQILLLLMLLLVILLIAVAAGRGILIRFPGAGGSTNLVPTQSAILGGQNNSQVQGGNRPDLAGQPTNAGNLPPACSPP